MANVALVFSGQYVKHVSNLPVAAKAASAASAAPKSATVAAAVKTAAAVAGAAKSKLVSSTAANTGASAAAKTAASAAALGDYWGRSLQLLMGTHPPSASTSSLNIIVMQERWSRAGPS